MVGNRPAMGRGGVREVLPGSHRALATARCGGHACRVRRARSVSVLRDDRGCARRRRADRRPPRWPPARQRSWCPGAAGQPKSIRFRQRQAPMPDRAAHHQARRALPPGTHDAARPRAGQATPAGQGMEGGTPSLPPCAGSAADLPPVDWANRRAQRERTTTRSVNESWLVLYDADCGLCKWLLAALLRWDRAGLLLPLALQRHEADAFLGELAPEERIASWHLVSPSRERRSAGAALEPPLRLPTA